MVSPASLFLIHQTAIKSLLCCDAGSTKLKKTAPALRKRSLQQACGVTTRAGTGDLAVCHGSTQEGDLGQPGPGVAEDNRKASREG